MIIPLVRYIEVPDCPTIPDHPAWWLPSIIAGAIVAIALCIASAVISYNRWEAKKALRSIEAPERSYLDLDYRLKKVESYVGGSGP